MKNTVFLLITLLLFIASCDDDSETNSILGSKFDETTDATSSSSDDYEYVDLGLSVMWCNKNLGASSETANGDYYQWGNTQPGENFTSSECATYEVKFSSGYDIGGTGYDAAYVTLGDNWRMPSSSEFQELIESCDWEWTQSGLNYGYTITSSKTGNSIFLPAAGYYDGASIATNVEYSNTSAGYYWSSNAYVGSYSAYQLTFGERKTGYIQYFSRYDGMTIRPVYDANTDEFDYSAYSADGKDNGYSYVDLGLSVNWATYNVGASSINDYGNYYNWGETTVSTSTIYTYTSATYGVSIDDYSGDATYDVATKKWGENWRTPTTWEFDELTSDSCSWEWISYGGNGAKGYQVTGPSGKSIFLPAAGWCDTLVDRYGFYWSSTPYSDSTYESWILRFVDDDYSSNYIADRYMGISVRPVIDK